LRLDNFNPGETLDSALHDLVVNNCCRQRELVMAFILETSALVLPALYKPAGFLAPLAALAIGAEMQNYRLRVAEGFGR
jgi:hypothetical protein